MKFDQSPGARALIFAGQAVSVEEWTVRKYGIRLLPELYEHRNPMAYEAAVPMEMDLAEDLRAQGYTVTGGH